MNLQDYLEAWDGNDPEYLKAYYQVQAEEEEIFVSQLIELSKLPDWQRASSWILKYHLEQKQQEFLI